MDPHIARSGGQPACTVVMHLAELDLMLEGDAALVDDLAILDASGASIRQAGRPVERTAGGITAPFGPQGKPR